jgi:hypothetical protein
MQQQQQGELKRNVNMFIGLCQCVAFLGEAWWRVPGTCGSRYFSGQAMIGLVILLLVASFGRSDLLMQAWIVTAVWMAAHKIEHAKRARKGYCPHSRFVGNSLLSKLGGNRLAICLWEPLVTFVTGLLLIQNGHGYGGCLVYLAIAMFFSASYAAAQERAQIAAINDARADQEWLMQCTRK